MSLSHFLVVAPPCTAAFRSAANRPQQRPNSNSKTLKRNQSKKTSGRTKITTANLGFTGERKDPVWQCVKSCGACCKLDKGPSFPSPEEIFDDPSDVQIVLIFVEWNQIFSSNCMALRRKSSTRRLAVAV